MTISTSRGTLGVRAMPDNLDSGTCFLRGCPSPINAGVVRVNLDGVWTVLCKRHRDQLRKALDNPEPVPI